MSAVTPFVVLDTNIVLDLFVFKDPKAYTLHQALQAKELQWIATLPMREELMLVLQYPHIAKRINPLHGAAQVMEVFDAWAVIESVAAKAPITCKDPDDQKFIDLAVAHQAHIWSKDHAVRCMRKRLQALGATFCAWP
jgi:putative PIN family toxin of toxin-antitoxin system